MRKKTEARRGEILKAATKLFLAKGYERASMDELTAMLGYSKATIYNYFSSKEELFAQAMHNIIEINTKKVLTHITKLEGEPCHFWDSLHKFGEKHLKMQLSHEVLGMTRIMISEGERIQPTEITQQHWPSKGWMEIARYFQEAMEHQVLKPCDPLRAAMHFKGLLEADLLGRRLLHIINKVNEKQINDVVHSAIDVFKQAYQA